MQDLTSELSEHAEIFNKVVVYPATNFPGRTQENILGQLLRKKLEPPVETRVEEGRAMQASDEEASSVGHEEVWRSAGDWLSQRMVQYVSVEMRDDFTADERERGLASVNTGLRRKLNPRRPTMNDDDDNDDSDEEEDADEEMEDVGLAVTTVSLSSEGPVEFGMGKVTKNPQGNVRTEEDILRFSTNGSTVRPSLGPPMRK